MMKKCTCKNGKTDPKCPACNKGDPSRDHFHTLNREDSPKTAESFKLAAPGLWGGLSASTKNRILEAGKAGLTSAVVPGAAAALGAGLTAEPGQGMADAARAGLTAGSIGAAVGAGHHLGMTGTSDLAHSYQRGVGGDIRNMGNWGRKQMNLPPLAHPNTPAVKKPPAEVPAPNVIPPAEAPAPNVAPPEAKIGMFYEFGRVAALTAFDL
jgi:hypothetical protein